MKKILTISFILFLPITVGATGPLTLPFEDTHSINAYMDLDDRQHWIYDYAHPTPWDDRVTEWTVGNAYDGHDGTDYNLSDGTEVMSALGGTVDSVGNGYSNTYPGGAVIFGNFIKINHIDNLQTIYGHLETSSLLVSTSSTVTHGMHIADSGNSGYSSGPHLHFEVRDTGSAVDPYSEDLWTTNPPTLSPVYLSYPTISTTTIWESGRTYVIEGQATVNSGATLTIEDGAIIKFSSTNSGIIVEGTLNASGATTSPIYFTSFKDDSVGGDTNSNGTSTAPAASDWKEIKINSGGNATFNHSIVRYGSNSTESSNIFNNGGILNFNNSTSTLGVYYSIRGNAGTTTINSSYAGDSFYGVGMRGSATTTITNSKLSDNDIYGIDAGNYPYYTSLTLTNNKFDNNSSGTGYFDISNGLTLTNSGNTASGSGPKRFDLYVGTVASNKTVKGDGIPYVLYNTTVNSGATLTIEPGAMIKFINSSAGITINGTLDAQGATTSPIYFTSYNDDSVGGDSNGSATSPTGGDWTNLKTNSGGTATLSNVVVKYGTTNIYNSGGTLNFSYSTTSNASSYGSRSTSGTISITHSDLNNEYFGLSFEGGTLTFTGNNISTTTTYGLQNTTGSSVNAENNYWGASSGPYHSTLNPSGTGAAVWGVVDFDPWMTNWP